MCDGSWKLVCVILLLSFAQRMSKIAVSTNLTRAAPSYCQGLFPELSRQQSNAALSVGGVLAPFPYTPLWRDAKVYRQFHPCCYILLGSCVPKELHFRLFHNPNAKKNLFYHEFRLHHRRVFVSLYDRSCEVSDSGATRGVKHLHFIHSLCVIKNTTFQKLVLFLSSGERRTRASSRLRRTPPGGPSH